MGAPHEPISNQADIKIHYNDHGSGQPVVLIHGYPLNGASWEKQERVLLQAGYLILFSGLAFWRFQRKDILS